MASKQNVVTPSSADVETICRLASKKAIISVTPVNKTLNVYRVRYKCRNNIKFSGISPKRHRGISHIYDINLNIGELDNKSLIMLAGCDFPIIFAAKGPANKNPVGTIYRVKNTNTTVCELDDDKYSKLLFTFEHINTPAGKTAFIKQATLDEMPDIYVRAVLKN